MDRLFLQKEPNSLSCTFSHLFRFPHSKIKEGCGYSWANTARSAIATFYDNVKDNPMKAWFMKGVLNLWPSLPWYTCTWDVTDVLNHLKTLLLPTIDLKTLSKKIALLLLLFSGERLQKLYTLKVSNIHVSTSACSIFLDSLLKTSSPHSHKSHLKFNYYSDTNLCIIVHIERYSSLAQSLKETTASLFISYCKPYKPVSTDTISLWVKHLLQELTLKPFQPTALEQLQY